jgi:flavodoxin
VDQVRAAFDPAAFSVSVKPAAATAMPDLAGADLVVFGLQKAQGGDAPVDYAELLRSLKGVNLGGRAAAIFSLGADKASAKLRKVLRDTDITLLDDEPALPSDQKPALQPEIEAWARKLASSLLDLRSARA